MTEYNIYKIKSLLTDKIYIGSTRNALTTRLNKHRHEYKKWLNDNNCHYVTSFEILKFNDYVIELIESCVYIDKLERNKREGHFIKLNKLICVNKRLEGRTEKEYMEDNKEKLAEKQKQYNEDNKEKIKERRKKYRDTHKEEIKERKKQDYQNHKEKINERVKQYNNSHKEEKKQYDKEYKESHRTQLKEKLTEKHTCDICKSIYTHQHKSSHNKTNKHIEKLNRASYDITITYNKDTGHIKQLS